jgi:hypothetical protein
MIILQNQGQSRNRNYSDLTNPAKNRRDRSESKGIHCTPGGSVRGITRGIAAMRASRVRPGRRTHAVHIAVQWHQLGPNEPMMPRLNYI